MHLVAFTIETDSVNLVWQPKLRFKSNATSLISPPTRKVGVVVTKTIHSDKGACNPGLDRFVNERGSFVSPTTPVS